MLFIFIFIIFLQWEEHPVHAFWKGICVLICVVLVPWHAGSVVEQCRAKVGHLTIPDLSTFVELLLHNARQLSPLAGSCRVPLALGKPSFVWVPPPKHCRMQRKAVANLAQTCLAIVLPHVYPSQGASTAI